MIGVAGGGVAKCDECGTLLKFELTDPTQDDVRAAATAAGWKSGEGGRLLCPAH